MELQGKLAVLTAEEQRITGLPSPIPVDAISVSHIENRLNDREDRIFAAASADDDEITLSEKAKINFERIELARDRKVAEQITTILFDREIAMIVTDR